MDSSKRKRYLMLSFVFVVIIASALYLKNQTSYSLIKRQVPTNLSDKKDDRSSKDRAIDLQVAKQREKNQKDWLESGQVGSLRRNKGNVGPEWTLETTKKINSAVKKYISSRPDRYPPLVTDSGNNEELHFMMSVDYRIEDLINEIPVEERKEPIEGCNNENITIQEARRLDGNYDELVLIHDMGQDQWHVVFAGSYYEFRDLMQ